MRARVLKESDVFVTNVDRRELQFARLTQYFIESNRAWKGVLRHLLANMAHHEIHE